MKPKEKITYEEKLITAKEQIFLGTISVREAIVDLEASDKADIKGAEIARLTEIKEYDIATEKDTLKIEVVNIEEIKGGVQVFARAWNNKGQIGFGSDGTVDIERFRIINPPILVDDPSGDIIQKSINEKTGKEEIRILREDPKEALLQSITDTIRSKNEVFDDKKIQSGKLGNTTTTVYAGGDSVSRVSNATWSTARDATTSTVQNLSTGYVSSEKEGSNYNIYVPLFGFDTSAISSGDTISAATFSVYLNGDNQIGDSQTLAIGQSAQATWNSIVSGDIDARGHTGSLGSSGVTHPNGATSGYLDFALNATGIGFIAKSGETKPGSASASGKTQLSVLYSSDTSNSAPTVRCYSQFRFSEQTGTSSDPKLVVEHAAAGSPAFIPRMMVF